MLGYGGILKNKYESADVPFDLLIWTTQFIIACLAFTGGLVGSCLLLLYLTNATIGIAGHPARLFPRLVGLTGLVLCRQPGELGCCARGMFVSALWIMFHD
jgi:hypothetical protein